MRSLYRRASQALGAPVDIASLAAFRVLFGLVLAAGTLRFLVKGWVRTQLIEPRFHFAYDGFEFFAPWPGAFMYLHVVLMLAAALGVALGLFYRVSAAVFLIAFGYLELLDRARYLNHYYLVGLLAALLVCLPAAGAWSLDAWRKPALRFQAIPALALLALRVQVGVVYVFAGLAKLNRDWLLEAQPLRGWLAARSDVPLFGVLLREPATAYAASWSGALFDLSIVPLLLVARTRKPAFALLVVFHAVTGWLFPIGMFPWIMTACATLFFSPGWPRKLLARAQNIPTLPALPSPPEPRCAHLSRALAFALLVHCTVQVALPLHQQLFHRDGAWTYRGWNFAWKVMLVEKVGSVELVARDRRTGRVVPVALHRYLAPWQERAMAQDPELIHSFARHVAHEYQQRGHDVAITANAFASLNGRPAQRLIDPAVDLTRPLPEGWILPLRVNRHPSR